MNQAIQKAIMKAAERGNKNYRRAIEGLSCGINDTHIRSLLCIDRLKKLPAYSSCRKRIKSRLDTYKKSRDCMPRTVMHMEACIRYCEKREGESND